VTRRPYGYFIIANILLYWFHAYMDCMFYCFVVYGEAYGRGMLVSERQLREAELQH